MSRWVVTGGAGYIGGHVVAALVDQGIEVTVLDDLSTGRTDRVVGADLVVGSIDDPDVLERVLPGAAGVMHLAAKKAVEESVADPLLYYRVNVEGTRALLDGAVRHGVERFVFTSSGSVYGDVEAVPYVESGPTNPVSPYARTKLIGEQMVADVAATGALRGVSLRYFNVAAASSPQLADDSVTNLIPIVLRAVRDGTTVTVFGDDYPTTDGTCIRDYVHVADIASAHVAAIDLASAEAPALNLGTGTGLSVLEIIDSVRRVLDVEVPVRIGGRRPGDPAVSVASVDRMRALGGWQPTCSAPERIVRDAASAAGLL